MLNLNQEEKKIIEKVINEMCECGLFCGRYDAKNGNEHFMYGVSTVMESLAYLVSEDFGDEFTEIFLKNMLESKKSA